MALQVSALFHIASSKGPPPIPENISPECRDFLLLCFNRVPKERPNATRLLQHPFLAGVGYKAAPPPGALTLNTAIPPRLLGDLPSPIPEEPSHMGTAPASPQTPRPHPSAERSLEAKAGPHLAAALHKKEVEAKENRGLAVSHGQAQNSPVRQPFRASQPPQYPQRQPQTGPQPEPWGQPQAQHPPRDLPQPKQHPWGQQQPQAGNRPQWGQFPPAGDRRSPHWGSDDTQGQAGSVLGGGFDVPPARPQWAAGQPQRQEAPMATRGQGGAEAWADAVPVLTAESSASMSDAFNPVEEPDSFDGMYACDSMDIEQPLSRRRAEMQGSCESLAASSPSHSMELKPLPSQQSRPAAFAQACHRTLDYAQAWTLD
ncbi:hypothetical protein ABBQ32_008022 [Trebouxia sp. C0010 RCD-2024]